jgi:hypothetical protein
MLAMNALLERVEGARADVAEDDPERRDDQSRTGRMRVGPAGPAAALLCGGKEPP